MSKNKIIHKTNARTWSIVVACFLMVMITLGLCSGTKGLFLDVITDALGVDRSLFSINDSCRFITTAVVNLFFGALISRFGPRKLVAAGFFALICSMLIYSVADVIYEFYIGGILLGLGLSWTTTTMVGYIVECWYKEKKGTIMGAVLAANGVGSAIATQFISPLIHNVEDPFAYRSVYQGIAVILAVTAVVVVSTIKDKSADERPAVTSKKAKGNSWAGISFSEAVRKPYFYITITCVFFTGASLQSVSGITSAHLRDVGFADSYVDLVLSVHAIALAAFKFLGGLSYDKLGLKKTLLICNVSAVVMTFLLAVVQVGPGGGAIAMVFGILSSAALPLETIMLPLITSELFGKASYAKLLGLLVSVNTAGYAIGVPVTNLCYDMTNSYTPILLVFSGIMLAAIVAYFFIFRMVQCERHSHQEENVKQDGA